MSKLTKEGLEKTLDHYIKNNDIFTARNLLNSFGEMFKGFPCEKYLKLMDEAEKRLNKKDLKEE